MFYKNLAKVYQHVFPASKKARFVNSQITRSAKILDVGCADGRMALALSKYGHCVDAFDLSNDMVEIALTVSCDARYFNVKKGDMLTTSSIYGNKCYQVVLCTGNTLVHLQTHKQIKQTLREFYSALENDGILILQIINYDTVYDLKIKSLPLIDNEFVRFERHYQLSPNHVVFSTTLKIKESNQCYQSKTQLLALRPHQLKSLFEEVGFTEMNTFSSYDSELFKEKQLSLIITAKKN